MAMTPEGKVKEAIRRYLKSLPNCWFYFPVQNGMGIVGIPDIIAVIGGRFVAIECKAPGKEKNTTPNQNRVIEFINKAGGVAFVASSVDTVKAKLFLEGVLVP